MTGGKGPIHLAAIARLPTLYLSHTDAIEDLSGISGIAGKIVTPV
jgi:hypothetical protein